MPGLSLTYYLLVSFSPVRGSALFSVRSMGGHTVYMRRYLSSLLP